MLRCVSQTTSDSLSLRRLQDHKTTSGFATASQTTRLQDYKWLRWRFADYKWLATASLCFADYKTTRLQDYKWLRWRFAMLRRLQVNKTTRPQVNESTRLYRHEPEGVYHIRPNGQRTKDNGQRILQLPNSVIP